MVSENVFENALTEFARDCLKIIDSNLYSQDVALCCQIHHANWSTNAMSHNCLGCNLADSVDRIRHGLMHSRSDTSINESISSHILNMYLFAERAEFIYKITTNKSLGDNNFVAFGKIKRWANFIKHPKAFMLVHHPDFNFEDSGIEFPNRALEINQLSIDKYYANGSKNSELLKKIQNAEEPLVVYPNMRQLTQDFCDEVVRVTRQVTETDFMDKLKDMTTIEQYFDDE